MDYSPMAPHYDDIMIKGQYYDYEAVAGALAAITAARRVLELGTGTGLVLQHLLKIRPDYEAVTGVDITPGMLEIARERLQPWPQVDLHEQDVTRLDLGRKKYDIVCSYGGPWYFVPDAGGWAMVSHILDDSRNVSGLERAAAHLVPGEGRLLLGIQDPHRNYSRPLGDGTTYTQHLSSIPGGFRKEYLLTLDGAPGEPLVHQVTDYRFYTGEEAFAMLARCGLRPVLPGRHRDPKFLEFAQA